MRHVFLRDLRVVLRRRADVAATLMFNTSVALVGVINNGDGGGGGGGGGGGAGGD